MLPKNGVPQCQRNLQPEKFRIPCTVGHRPRDPLNVNQIGFFLASSSKVSQIEPENASGAMKSQKAAI